AVRLQNQGLHSVPTIIFDLDTGVPAVWHTPAPKSRGGGLMMDAKRALDRRSFLGAATAAVASAAAVTVAPKAAHPHDRDCAAQSTVRYPDPDVVVLDPRFAKYKIGNPAIQRLHTGMAWAEGPAWSSGGRYLVWSDIPNDLQLRRTDENGVVSVFRDPAGNSNGNTFDFEGRQIACEHANRRVVRYEHTRALT